MVRRVATRSERRTGKKQVLVLLALVLVASLASFSLGVVVGRGKRPAASAAQPTRLPVAQPVPSPAVAASEGERQSESLTFYDSLAKGGKPPLGSGINLPPPGEPPSATEIPADEGEPKKAATDLPPPAPAEAPVPAAVNAVLPTPPPTRKGVTTTEKGGAYLVQVAAFRKPEDASSLQARLGRKGYSVFTRETQLGDKGVWYRVYVGPFATAGSAEKTVSRLKSEEKLTAMIRKN